jgi:hypothetical protein
MKWRHRPTVLRRKIYSKKLARKDETEITVTRNAKTNDVVEVVIITVIKKTVVAAEAEVVDEKSERRLLVMMLGH